MKSLLRKTPIWPWLQKQRKQHRIRTSPPYLLELGETKVRFHTNDPYSWQWFWPLLDERRLHEEVATQRFHELAKQSETIVDIGTNLGWFLCLAACSKPSAKVYGFELDENNHALCRKNLELNQLTQVTLEHGAVAEKSTQIEYAKYDSDSASASHRLGCDGSVMRRVQAHALDDYFQDKPCPELIKIDVEGAELKVLQGMSRLLADETCRHIFIEIHPAWLRDLGGSAKEVYTILREAGFKVLALDHRERDASEREVRLEEIEGIGTGGEMFLAMRA